MWPGTPVAGRSSADHCAMPSARIESVTAVLGGLVELLLPRTCIGCGLDGSAWCRDCLAGEFDPVLHRPDPCPAGLPELAAAATYSGSVRGAILAAKERDRHELDRSLGLLLAGAVGVLLGSRGDSAGSASPIWLVPVPASPAAIRQRGRDHVSDWTRWAIRALRASGTPAHRVRALRRRSGGLDSVGLDAGQRVDNLDGAFIMRAVSRPAPTTAIIIVDDIVTTGATIVAASTILARSLDLDMDQARQRLGAAVVGATQRTTGRGRG